MNKLKLDIKEMAAMQPVLKNQRKTVKIEGDRFMDAETARRKHLRNRDVLRYMHIAYGMMKGKTLDDIEPRRKSEPYMKHVNEFIERYSKEDAA